MPMYSFQCDCGKKEESILPMSMSSEPHPCPVCGQAMKRDYAAEAGSQHFAEPPTMYSDAVGVHPHQIAEAQARFPHHRFTPDGRMIFDSQREKERVLKDIGFVDHAD